MLLSWLCFNLNILVNVRLGTEDSDWIHIFLRSNIIITLISCELYNGFNNEKGSILRTKASLFQQVFQLDQIALVVVVLDHDVANVEELQIRRIPDDELENLPCHFVRHLSSLDAGELFQL